tara:strand:+ start:9444 stop:9887 length:444 start_codon:yes stop_codon:yes gene_type:complete
MKLIEILDTIETCVDTVPTVKESTVCTMEDMIIRVSEKKNRYIGAFIIYDQNQIRTGESSVTIPITIVFADKLRTNDNNKKYIHSNTLSTSIDAISLLRVKINEIGCDGLNDCVQELWTEQFSDALLAGTKLDFTIQANLNGFCDIL